jgi:dCTP deaminase
MTTTLLNDYKINEFCSFTETPMIAPFVSGQLRLSPITGQRVISYGTSSYGYDIRCSDEFKIFSPANGFSTIIDPKAIDEYAMVDFQGSYCIIPPNSFALARSIETFHMPQDVLGICLGKSTYARCGVVVNCTPLEPGWRGTLTIEISNTTPLPVKIYALEGIAQVLFFQADRPHTTYSDRNGKYQGQTAIALPRV